jgi:hypothetical protein
MTYASYSIKIYQLSVTQGLIHYLLVQKKITSDAEFDMCFHTCHWVPF